jgi:hypothetical protein
MHAFVFNRIDKDENRCGTAQRADLALLFYSLRYAAAYALLSPLFLQRTDGLQKRSWHISAVLAAMTRTFWLWLRNHQTLEVLAIILPFPRELSVSVDTCRNADPT